VAKLEREVEKVGWFGCILSVQPRISLMRSFDQRYHSYKGYMLRIEGTCGDKKGEFLIAVGKEAHEKHQFFRGMTLSGESVQVLDPRLETAGFYKTSRIKIINKAENGISQPPPFYGISPSLEIYRQRGHRRLDARTYETKCAISELP
jgi:hypothetical protein